MGYPIELFLYPNLVDKEFMCCICHDVLKVPTMSEICEHIYCTSCIQQWTTTSAASASPSSSAPTSATCPIDRQPIAGLRIPIRSYMNMYQGLLLKCGFDGCSTQTNLGDYEDHVKSCQHNPDAKHPCIHDCGALIKTKEIPTHNCIQYLKQELQKEKSGSVSELRFKFEVEHVSEQRHSFLSQPSFARKLPWRIVVMPRLNSNQEPSHLGFFLNCNAESETTWNCHASATLKLLSFNPDVEPYPRRIDHTFISIDYDWGYANFISWPELMNPAKGFVQNDKMVLEVVLKADVPVFE